MGCGVSSSVNTDKLKVETKLSLVSNPKPKPIPPTCPRGYKSVPILNLEINPLYQQRLQKSKTVD
jgi:hypothetical protein